MLNSLEKIFILAENSVVLEYDHIMEPFLLPLSSYSGGLHTQPKSEHSQASIVFT